MHVFLHLRRKGLQTTDNEVRDFVQIPGLGEYVSLETTPAYFLVKVVIHTPHGGDIDAEVFAVEVDHLDALKPAFED
jgi:hypothetical protein